MPQRIQRKRVKGWRKPAGAMVVDRSTNWGNPYEAKYLGADRALLVGLYRDWIKSGEARFVIKNIDRLRGKDLVCWCPLDQPCHADVLLELANRAEPDEHERGSA